MTAVTLVDVDLDQPGIPTRRTRRPFRLLLVGVAVVGLVAGAVLRAADQPEAPPGTPQVLASVALRTIMMLPQPSAVLEIRMTNLGHDREVADSAVVFGGGLSTVSAALGLDLPPGTDGVRTATVPLNCALPDRSSGPVTVRVRTRTASSGPMLPGVDVPAVATGQVAQPSGLCPTADRMLPEGWRTPVTVTGWNLDPAHRLTVQVSGLPAGMDSILAVQADGWLLPWADGPPGVQNRTARLVLDPPTPGCRDGAIRKVASTGMQLILAGAGSTTTVYAQVGPAEAGWLADAFARSCPNDPDGPSSIRTGFDE